jgi:hypothetical protein
LDRNVDTVAPNPLPNKERRIKPIDEEQLAHTVESMLKDEPDSNEVVALAVSIFVSSLFKECRRLINVYTLMLITTPKRPAVMFERIKPANASFGK